MTRTLDEAKAAFKWRHSPVKRALVPAAKGLARIGEQGGGDRCQQEFHRPAHFSSYFIRRRIP
jgi:hypothetical protein